MCPMASLSHATATMCDFPALAPGSTEFCGGQWTTGGGDFLWAPKASGPTPSAGTGPSTGPDGGSYVYINARGHVPSQTAYLESKVVEPPRPNQSTA